MARAHREWIEEALNSDLPKREELWSKSIAVGDSFMLRESQESYGVNFTPENRVIALNNGYFFG